MWSSLDYQGLLEFYISTLGVRGGEGGILTKIGCFAYMVRRGGGLEDNAYVCERSESFFT